MKILTILCVALLFLFSCKSGNKDENQITLETKEKINIPKITSYKDGNTATKVNIEYIKLKNLIIQTTDKKGLTEYTCDLDLPNKVLNFVYFENADSISGNQKLDLIFLLEFFHRVATNEYVSKVLHSIKKNERKVVDNPIFLLPLIPCEYCGSNVIKQIMYLENIKTPEYYKQYSTEVIDIFSTLDTNNLDVSTEKVKPLFIKCNNRQVKKVLKGKDIKISVDEFFDK